MTWAAVGSFINQFNVSSFSLTPGGVGDLILLEVNNKSNNTVSASSLSSSNVTWAQMGTTLTVTNGTVVLFAGTVTSTSAATVTITWSGTTPASYQTSGQEFSSTVGSWALDVQGNLNSAGTNTWSSLTPATSGELYFGYGFDSATAVAGSTTGYTYNVDLHSNGEAYNLNCASGVATAPVWGDSTMRYGIMVLVEETGASGPSGQVQPRATVTWPRRYPARAVVYFTPVRTANATPTVAGTVQPRATIPVPRRLAGRAAWRGSAPFGGFVTVAAPRQQIIIPRRRPARAVVYFTPVTTTNAAAVVGTPGVQAQMNVNRTEVISRVTGRVIRR